LNARKLLRSLGMAGIIDAGNGHSHAPDDNLIPRIPPVQNEEKDDTSCPLNALQHNGHDVLTRWSHVQAEDNYLDVSPEDRTNAHKQKAELLK